MFARIESNHDVIVENMRCVDDVISELFSSLLIDQRFKQELDRETDTGKAEKLVDWVYDGVDHVKALHDLLVKTKQPELASYFQPCP